MPRTHWLPTCATTLPPNPTHPPPTQMQAPGRELKEATPLLPGSGVEAAEE